MRNYILLPIFTIFLFSACSFKMPEFLTFSDINYDELLKEANICQDLDTQKEKLDCYKKIETTPKATKAAGILLFVFLQIISKNSVALAVKNSKRLNVEKELKSKTILSI